MAWLSYAHGMSKGKSYGKHLEDIGLIEPKKIMSDSERKAMIEKAHKKAARIIAADKQEG